MKIKQLTLVIVLAFMFLAAGLLSLAPINSVEAAPPAVAGTLITLNGRTTSYTQTATTGAVDVGNYDTLIVQYAIDNPDNNPITITLQSSVTGFDWATQAVLVSDNSTDDATAITKTVDFGRYVRLSMVISNTDTITPHVAAWAK